MSEHSYSIVEMIPNRLFEASGANLLFEEVFNDLTAGDIAVFDFAGIDAISTSFAGRFMEHVQVLKSKLPGVRVSILNAKAPIRNALTRG